MPIPHLVEETANVLQSSLATPKEKLIIGGKLLQAAMMFSKNWTPELMNEAKTAYHFLLDHGNMKRTVEEMDEKDANRRLAQFTNDVMHLATGIKQARSQQPRPRRS
jgi:hypothetical protein